MCAQVRVCTCATFGKLCDSPPNAACAMLSRLWQCSARCGKALIACADGWPRLLPEGLPAATAVGLAHQLLICGGAGGALRLQSGHMASGLHL